jgi:hypothetical protein
MTAANDASIAARTTGRAARIRVSLRENICSTRSVTFYFYVINAKREWQRAKKIQISYKI